jgi:ornithine cyclodeaminase/alanine dehydrogenase
MLYLNRSQIESMRIPVKEVIQAVEEGFTLKGEGMVQLPRKPEIHPREDCYIHAMPSFISGIADTAGIKWVSRYPSNPEKGLPLIMGLIILNDAETGMPLAVMDAGWITAYRTGAATAITAKKLAPKGASTLSIIGLGVQARTQLIALRETMKGLRKVKAFDISPDHARKFLEEMERKAPELEIEISPDLESALGGSDIVVTCTPIRHDPKRFIPAEWLKNDVLAVSVDYDSAFEASVMTEASFFTTDDRDQYFWMKEGGVYFSGYPAEVQADIGEICAGKKEAPRNGGRRAAVLIGLASHDLVTARVIYDKACRTGIGTVLEF